MTHVIISLGYLGHPTSHDGSRPRKLSQHAYYLLNRLLLVAILGSMIGFNLEHRPLLIVRSPIVRG
jgi:hypothetical protein